MHLHIRTVKRLSWAVQFTLILLEIPPDIWNNKNDTLISSFFVLTAHSKNAPNIICAQNFIVATHKEEEFLKHSLYSNGRQ